MRNRHLMVAYHNTFESPEGRTVLAHLRKSFPLMDRALAETNTNLDPQFTLYQEGQRSVLMHIYRMLRRDPNEPMPQRALNETGE